MRSLLFLHGAMGTAIQWDALAQKFSGLDIHIPDLPYHGGTSGIEPFTVDHIAIELAQRFAFGESRKWVIAGYSLGGYIGLKLAALYPDQVEAVLSYGTKFSWDPDNSSAEAGKLNIDMLRDKAPAFIEQQKSLHGDGWETCLQKVAELMLDLGHGGAFKPEELVSIKARVLSLVGAEDRMVTAAETQEISALLPNGEMRIVPGCKHALESVPVEYLAVTLRESFGEIQY